MDDERRLITGREADRTATQIGHPQFHCGTPPPAAEPRMRIRI
jgi:hypothetical protein